MKLSWSGNPTTKKNSQQIVWRKAPQVPKKKNRCWPWQPFLVPSAAYKKALKAASKEIAAQVAAGTATKIDTGICVQVEAHFYLGPRQSPDLDGLMNACADILEACGIVKNDYWIVSWDGTRRLRDVESPRTEVFVTILPQRDASPQELAH